MGCLVMAGRTTSGYIPRSVCNCRSKLGDHTSQVFDRAPLTFYSNYDELCFHKFCFPLGTDRSLKRTSKLFGFSYVNYQKSRISIFCEFKVFRCLQNQDWKWEAVSQTLKRWSLVHVKKNYYPLTQINKLWASVH